MIHFRPATRWLKYALRAVLILLALAGVGLGVLGWRVAAAHSQRAIATEIVGLGGYVRLEQLSLKPAWLGNLVGDQLFAEPCLVECDSPQLTDRTLEQIGKLGSLQWLLVDSGRITDRGLGYLRGLDQLARLDVGSRRITDAGLLTLAQLPRLQWLTLRRTQVTAQAVERLRQALPGCTVQWQSDQPSRPTPAAPTHDVDGNQLADA